MTLHQALKEMRLAELLAPERVFYGTLLKLEVFKAARLSHRSM
ncbi:hypothetical protein R77567_04428 [Ralstonia sp. LMG 32965]|uniref:Uncharacterized protein n=1 Tax=Ralstonia flatus TaxID=3058601 RepID=A0AAD2F6R6_9RALS|nr:hypothetical protein R77567_04428 [Ralstonia sp. LMG 32965]CAJ0902908.1 hypothetical protein R77564_04815 [Ralstonia sp. LMG 32965]